MSIRCKGKLEKVTQIKPVKHKDKVSGKKFVSLYIADTFSRAGLLEWEDFIPSKKGVSYGESYAFSYAGFFNLKRSDFDYCDNISINVKDYLENNFETL